MIEVSIYGVPHKPVLGNSAYRISPARLRRVIPDSHLSFLIGAGTPSSFFGLLGKVEDARAHVAGSTAGDDVKAVARASLQTNLEVAQATSDR